MKILKWFWVAAGIFALIGVRGLEDKLFYDPFLEFFHGDYRNSQFPDFQWNKLVFSYLFRFFLNWLISGFIIYFIFLNFKWALQGMALMLTAFLIFFPIYLWCIYGEFRVGWLFAFYVRRFVIQPVILLVIVPIFYYRQYAGKS